MERSLKQCGMALVVLLFVLGIGSLGYIWSSLDGRSLQLERDRKTAEALLDAKAALIGWSVGHPSYPGILPFPDRNGDGNYDGNSDCVVAASLTYQHLLGKLPHLAQTTPCIGAGASQYGISADLIDGHGQRLWYAVSKNLIRTSVAVRSVVINPAIIHSPVVPWLIVRNKNGQILSDRVAAVIISSGMPVGLQNRSSELAGPGAYLDSITASGVTYSNVNYTVANEDFIVGDDMQYVSSTNSVYQQPYQFNDKLIYITIDELILALEKRVIREAATTLNAYYLASAGTPSSRFYPYASALNDVDHVCEGGLLMGALPLVDGKVSCAHTGVGSMVLPAWFVESRWQDYLYYAISSNCTYSVPGCAVGELTVGARGNVNALLMSAGPILATQSRPSNNLTDYFDSAENANGDFIFDAVGTIHTSTYNDQMLIVSP